tara:strand:+ start:3182 stop:4471 length:1290 start_codon:yes stop_codon:yes gene_type:complete
MFSVSNAIYLFLEKGTKMALSFLSGVLLARYLGVSEFGTLSSAISIRTIIIIFCSMGLEVFAMREFSRRSRQSNEIVLSLIVIRIVTVIFSTSLMCILYYYENISAVYLFLVISGILYFLEPLEYRLKSVYKSKVIAKASIISALFSFMFKVYLIENEFSLLYISMSYIFDMLVYFCILVYLYCGVFELFNLKVKLNRVLSNVFYFSKEGFFLLFSAFSVIVYTKVDVIMLSEMNGDIDAGLYSAATRISDIWLIIPPILTQALIPYIAKKYKSNSEFGQFGRSIMQITVICSLSFIILIYFTSDFIIELVYGDEFSASSKILQLHVIAGLFSAIGNIQASWMYTWGLARFAALKNVIACCLGLALNLILIPHFGVYGAATATIISIFASSVLLNVVHSKSREVFYSFWRSIFLLDLGLVATYNVKHKL